MECLVAEGRITCLGTIMQDTSWDDWLQQSEVLLDVTLCVGVFACACVCVRVPPRRTDRQKSSSAHHVAHCGTWVSNVNTYVCRRPRGTTATTLPSPHQVYQPRPWLPVHHDVGHPLPVLGLSTGVCSHGLHRHRCSWGQRRGIGAVGAEPERGWGSESVELGFMVRAGLKRGSECGVWGWGG